MRITLLATLLLLTSCAAYVNKAEIGKQAIRDAKAVMGQTEADLCVTCGNGCIPRELAPLTLCQATTERFTCEFKDNACSRVN